MMQATPTPSPPDAALLLTPREAAPILKMGINRVHELKYTVLPFFKLYGRWYTTRADLEAWAAEQIDAAKREREAATQAV